MPTPSYLLSALTNTSSAFCCSLKSSATCQAFHITSPLGVSKWQAQAKLDESASQNILKACLVHLEGLDGVVRHHIEGLEVEAAGGEDHSARLDAERRDAAAHKLQQNALVLILQPPGIEFLACLMLLPCNLGSGARWNVLWWRNSGPVRQLARGWMTWSFSTFKLRALQDYISADQPVWSWWFCCGSEQIRSKWTGWWTCIIVRSAALASSLPSFVSSFLLSVHSSVILGRISSTDVYTREKRNTLCPCETIKASFRLIVGLSLRWVNVEHQGLGHILGSLLTVQRRMEGGSLLSAQGTVDQPRKMFHIIWQHWTAGEICTLVLL